MKPYSKGFEMVLDYHTRAGMVGLCTHFCTHCEQEQLESLVVKNSMRQWPLQSNLNKRHEVNAHQETGISSPSPVWAAVSSSSMSVYQPVSVSTFV